MAAVIGCNQGEVSRWERGLSRPREKYALRWLGAIEAIEVELARAGKQLTETPPTNVEGATGPISPDQAENTVPLSRRQTEARGADD